jgi:hypothetical protein
MSFYTKMTSFTDTYKDRYLKVLKHLGLKGPKIKTFF